MKIKKSLSLLLALCLCLGLFPSAALAAEDFVIDENGVLTEYHSSSDDVVIPDGVTAIGDYAFRWMRRLTSVTIPDSVTSIGDSAFNGCTGLTGITIPDSVITIGECAFENCSGLTSITIPGSVTSIGNWAFQNCTGLTSITIPDSVTAIGDGAFSVCTGLTSAVLGNGVISIGENTFQRCTNLTNVVIGNSVTSINQCAFQDCTGLTNVTIPGSVTSIDNCAFEGCTGLTSITIPDSVTSIGDSAFSRCTGLTSITIPDSVTTIGRYAFSGCTGLQTVSVPSALETVYVFPETTEITRRGYYFDVKDGVLKGYRGTGGDVVIPNGVTEIGFIAFEDRSDLTSITIPNSVTTIGSGAFEGCTGLTGITIPDSVTTIDYDAFKGCTGLTSITIPDSVTTLGSSAFEGCTGLTSVTIGDGLTDINWTCFRDCANIASLTLGNHVERVSFHLPLLVRELVIPDSVTEWPELQCPRLTKLTFPKNNWVFKGISRADFMEGLKNYPALNEIVNCPNEYVEELIAPNATLRDNWTDPRSTIVPQSARITKLSNEITAGCTTEYDKAKAISEWVSTHIKYDDDYYYEGLKDYSDVPFNPEEILDKGQAVCAGYARLTQALLAAQNIPCLYVLGWTKPDYHAWNLALIDGEYLWIDNTWHGINGKNYFGLGIYAISKDHTSVSGAAFNGVKGPGTTVSISETEAGRLEINPSWLDLGTVREGYQQSAAQTITVRNTGTKAVTLTQPTAVNFEVGRLSRTTLNAGESAAFTVRPKVGLKANGTVGRSYEETLTVQGDNGFTVQLELTFKVEPAAALAGVSDWAQPYVAQAIELGILPQDLQSLYDQATTRQEFCVLADNLYLALMGHYPNSGERMSFTDTSDKYVLDMARAKVVSGVGGGRFEPDRSLEREEAATLLSQFALAVNKPLASYNATFADKAEVSDWALPFVGAMQNCGVMKGVGGNRFEPHGDYTREQSVVTIMLMYELLK